MSKDTAEAINNLRNAVTPALSGRDDVGGYVTSLTEAVMSMTRALTKIANAIEYSNSSIASALEDHSRATASIGQAIETVATVLESKK